MPRLVQAPLGRDRGEPFVVGDHLDTRADRDAVIASISDPRRLRAAGPFAPESESGRPTTIVVTSSRPRSRRSRGDRRRGHGCGATPSAATRPCASDPRARARCGPNRGRRRARLASRAESRSSRRPTPPPARGRAASASSMPATFGPPPTTASVPLPTPPPSAFAAGAAIASADTPRSTRSLLTATAIAGLHAVGTGAGQRDHTRAERAHRLLREPLQLARC